MGAYNIVNATRLVAGQPEDVGDVYANFQAIQAVLNGGIDNSNINVAAAIAKSKLAALAIVNADIDAAAAIAIAKLAGYPADGTKFLAGDASWKVAAPTTYRKFTAKDVVNTVAATDLLNGEITVGAGVMGVTGKLRCRLAGDYLNNTGANQTTSLKIKLGGVTLWNSTTVPFLMGVSSNRRAWVIEFEIENQNATNVNFLSGTVLMGSGINADTGLARLTDDVGVTAGVQAQAQNALTVIASNGTTAVDTTAACALIVEIVHGAANANLSMRLESALVEVI